VLEYAWAENYQIIRQLKIKWILLVLEPQIASSADLPCSHKWHKDFGNKVEEVLMK
jgi:hypothetical protein